MKNLNLLLLTLLALWGATATADVVFDETNFPDENFREAIADAFWEDYGIRLNDGDVLTDEMLNMEIDLGAEGYGIQSVQGIEYLAGLYTANLDMNQIEEIDLSHNHLLSAISLGRNPLRIINLSGCDLLNELLIGAWPNQSDDLLEEIDLSDCTSLRFLNISNLPLHSIDLSSNRLLSILGLENLTHLESINLSENTLIEDLNINNIGNIEFVDLSSLKHLKNLAICNNPYIESISFYKPNYINIDEIGLGIQTLYLENNSTLSTLDLGGQGILTTFDCRNNPSLTTLDLSDCSSLMLLTTTNSNLNHVDLSNCSSLKNVFLDHNHISNIDLSGCESLLKLNLTYNEISKLKLTETPLLNTLNIGYNNLNCLDSIIGINDCQLTYLDISYNPFKQLSLNGFENNGMNSLESLYCSFNSDLSTINIFNMENLQFLDIMQFMDDTPIPTTLNINNAPLLNSLFADNTHLKEIHFSDCPNLKLLGLDHNNLESLNIADFSLQNLYCADNKLKIIDGLINSINSLEILHIEDNKLTSINCNNFAKLKSLSCSNNHLNAINLVNLNSLVELHYEMINGRRVQVYQTDVDGTKQYYIPLATTNDHLGIKDLIEQENNYEDEDTGFDWARVVTESITGATLGELDGEQVLWLDPTTTGATEGLHRMTYQYLTHCSNEQYATVEFYLDWAEATGMTGDVNGDGKVAIDDVTALIDYLLSGDATGINLGHADVNSEGGITIADVTALIDILLSGNN